MISKKRLNLGISLRDGGSDVAMLFLAMKLVTSVPDPDTAPKNGELYVAAKKFLTSFESVGTVSLPLLQALVLVALYEYSHAIYPAAWMTVGACARYAEIIGLPSARDPYRVLGPATNWTEAEERRRVWWAIAVLDRVISLGSQRRCVTADPSDADMLPMTDHAWVRFSSLGHGGLRWNDAPRMHS
jgi:hypothetical protein